jgi:hypothetical protein
VKRKVRRIALLAGGCCLAVLAGLAILLLSEGGFEMPPLPVPNGYDDLMRAVKMAPSERLEDLLEKRKAPVAELRALLAKHREALEIARGALLKEWGVPIEPDPASFNAFISWDLSRLACLFDFEGIVAEKEGRLHDAIASYLDLFRLSVAACRGGLAYHVNAAQCMEIVAQGGLGKIRGKLSPEDRKFAISVLAASQAQEEPFEKVLARTEAYLWATCNIFQRARWMMERFTGGLTVLDLIKESHDFEEASSRLLLVELAARAYRNDKGKWPQDLGDLSPRYLDEVPVDPFTGSSFIYRIEGGKLLLYSVGPNRIDDGGVSKPMAAEGDLLLPPLEEEKAR